MSTMDIKTPFPEVASEDHDCRDRKMPASPANKKRKLYFHPEAVVYEIPHFEDFTQEEIADLWFQVPDYDAMAAENWFTVDMMTNGRLSENDDKFCGRGLEHRMPARSLRREKNIQAAREAVIDEQKLQLSQHSRDPDFLADIYSEITTRARDIARIKGLHDEKEAREEEVEKPAADNNTKRRRSVAFSPNVNVRVTVHFSEFTKEEICEIWYQKEEYKNIKAQRKVIARVLQSRNFQEDDMYVMRGLECMFPANSRARKHSKFLARESVLAEQDRQDVEGRSDPERLAQVYRESSLQCTVAAHHRGKSDELAIDLYTKDERLALQQLPQEPAQSEDKIRSSPKGRLSVASSALPRQKSSSPIKIARQA
jgi:hypothetical protein